ncbi:hypothetical protein [Candidatus Nitrospira allomarina]|uniref:RiboL-PSP-HEPN domain-containing protein n=1 Tax=Candidatus Nitrospira allomarina TaxID=3020900 RepID=A0AA96JRY5_9BACT|nr:hypothetical protein [Candidatus Nitrospira allomarina]WNM58032.1 hypothetical protein PP769_19000 [Candidatus Nitrospira allomarina]
MRERAKDLVKNLLPAITSDLDMALETAKEAPTPYNLRTAVRAAFAYMDGLIFITKTLVLVGAAQSDHAFSNAELALLREETYSLNSKGESYAQTKFLRLEDNFRFTLSMILKSANKPFNLDLNDGNWEKFKRSLQLRHRLTHPRQPIDLQVVSSEFEDLKTTLDWVSGHLMRGLAEATLVLFNKKEDLEARLKKLRQELGAHQSNSKIES